MKNKILNISTLFISFITLFISIKLFYNIGVFCDENNSSPDIVYGGYIYSILSWISLALLLLLCIISVIKVLKNST